MCLDCTNIYVNTRTYFQYIHPCHIQLILIASIFKPLPWRILVDHVLISTSVVQTSLAKSVRNFRKLSDAGYADLKLGNPWQPMRDFGLYSRMSFYKACALRCCLPKGHDNNEWDQR